MPALRSRDSTLVRTTLFLAMVFLLPLHTVYLRAWIAWKPFLVLLVILVAWSAVDGIRSRSWPWDRSVSVAVAIFVVAAAIGWFHTPAPERFIRLLLAIAVGAAVLLEGARGVETVGIGRVLKTVYWSAAAVGASAVILSFVVVGTFGPSALDTINAVPGIDRIAKVAYLDRGFVALTNWHQDPGYAAAWMNLWLVLAVAAVVRGHGSGRRWFDALVVGSLAVGVVMTASRTGWGVLIVGVPVGVLILLRSDAGRFRDVARLLASGALVAVVVLAVLWVVDRPGVGADLPVEFGFRVEQGATTLPPTTPTPGGGVPADYRGVVWPQYVEQFQSHPVLGIGLGTGWAQGQEPHNLALELLAETGLVGFLGFLVLIGVVLKRGRGSVGAAALVVALLPAFTQTVLFEPTWWFAAALYLAGGAESGRMP